MKKKFVDDESTLSEVNEPAVAFNTQLQPAMKVFHNPIDRSLSILGVAKPKNIAYNNKADLITLIRKGIEKKAIDNIAAISGFNALEMAAYLGTTDRTLRRYEPGQRLNAEQSERLLEIASLYVKGEEVFETMENFNLWMNTTVLALGNKKPKEFLDTSIGIALLEEELGRIAYGIFA